MKNKTPKFSISQELESFLKKKKCLTKFKNNLITGTTYTINSISGGFIWKDSIEGHSFWAELSEEFYTLINK